VRETDISRKELLSICACAHTFTHKTYNW